MRYFVRGVGYATTPAVYRSNLGAGCAGATHFVLNYAAGAYELGATADLKAKAGVSGLGAGGGGSSSTAAKALYRGGDLSQCAHAGPSCGAPVRLRLVPIVEGAPTPADAPLAAIATSKPTAGGSDGPLTPVDIEAALALAKPAMRTCYNKATRFEVVRSMRFPPRKSALELKMPFNFKQQK